MSYWGVNAYFLASAALVLTAALILRRPHRALWGSLGAAMLLLFALTAVFDNLIIAAGIVAYSQDQNISGVRMGLAPLEDFAYPLAGVLLLPALWLLLGGSIARRPPEHSDDSAAPVTGRPSGPATARHHRGSGDT